MERVSIKIYFEQWNAIKKLPYEDIGRLMEAVFNYSMYREVPINISDKLSMAFDFIKTQLDVDDKKFVFKCKKNAESAKKRWQDESIDANGCERIQTDANDADKEKDKEKDKDKDKDNILCENKPLFPQYSHGKDDINNLLSFINTKDCFKKQNWEHLSSIEKENRIRNIKSIIRALNNLKMSEDEFYSCCKENVEKKNSKPLTLKQAYDIIKSIGCKRAKALKEFKPPTIEQVESYFRDKGIKDNMKADNFFYHYDSIGWKTNAGRKIEHWDSLANKWMINDDIKAQESGKDDGFKSELKRRIEEADSRWRLQNGME